ncbi:sorting nexin 7 S homeolog isoform X1 [Xenopus laevis]|uniref:Sorting nexin 7 S homeolog isoform X1 n=1 Tax=Xenopus laevis TaxID=8355 RepID=A0A8J1MZB1_XENLA|nr:sorting nexin 7 S homeolog isoform X1 [Xenopus laevis]
MEPESEPKYVAVSPGCLTSGHSSLLSPLSPDALQFDEDDDLEVFSKGAALSDGNSFSPLMLASPSSMINQYKFEDEPDVKDIFVTVDEPESHVNAIETFITYRIATKTSRSQFDSCEFEVRRRYQDFLWLKSRLEDAHPTLIIPPLPEKFIVRGMVERFTEEFIETRRKALHKFLNRIADHPTLTFNEDFKIFLTAQAWELTSHKKQGPGLFSRMGQTIKAVASSVRGIKNRPDEFTELGEYVDAFSQKINVLDKISQRIYKEQKGYYEGLKEYGPVHTLWSASEEELVDSLKGMANCIDKCCKVTDTLNLKLSGELIPIIHEYVLYSETLSLKEEIEKLEDKVECANNALKADWERWKQNMQSDLSATFTNMAENRISHYEECLALWESFLSSQTCDFQMDTKE